MISNNVEQSTFSFEQIIRLRGETSAAIKTHLASALSLTGGLEELDSRLQISLAIRGHDEQQTLISAVQRLAALLGSVE